HGRTIEIGSRVAPPLALVTVMAGGAPAMIDGEIGNAIWHDPPAELAFNHFLRGEGTAGEVHGWQELTVWHLRQAFAGSTDADKALDHVVVGFQFLVADGPVFAETIAGRRFEFVVSEAIAFAGPAEGLATNLAAANPHKRFVRGECVGMFQI